MNNSKQFSHKILILLVSSIIVIITGIISYNLGKKQNAYVSETGRFLPISVETDASADSFTLSGKLLDQNYDITCFGFSGIYYVSGSTRYSLSFALENGLIYPDEIVALAKMDAKNGVCTESYGSTNGFAQFIYEYSDLQLHVIYDVYETPDGNQYLIQDLGFYAPGKSASISHVYLNESAEYPEPIDKEDWGLTFRVISADNSGITLSCTQADGQVIGTLCPEDYAIISGQNGWLSKLNTSEDVLNFSVNEIQCNTSTELTIDWSKSYGPLQSGSYTLKIWFLDKYTDDQVPPLCNNYYDSQSYYVEFEIP